MRLWHKDLIPYLPRQQLLGQWRECCLIAKEIAEKGAVNHILVRPVMDYPLSHFRGYTLLVQMECAKRGYRIRPYSFWKYFPDVTPILMARVLDNDKIFPEWHNRRYLEQCISNLQEKYDRGGLTEKEWATIYYSLEHIGDRRMRHTFGASEYERRFAI